MKYDYLSSPTFQFAVISQASERSVGSIQKLSQLFLCPLARLAILSIFDPSLDIPDKSNESPDFLTLREHIYILLGFSDIARKYFIWF